jgi:multidrug efflux system membrane fusion protein
MKNQKAKGFTQNQKAKGKYQKAKVVGSQKLVNVWRFIISSLFLSQQFVCVWRFIANSFFPSPAVHGWENEPPPSHRAVHRPSVWLEPRVAFGSSPSPSPLNRAAGICASPFPAMNGWAKEKAESLPTFSKTVGSIFMVGLLLGCALLGASCSRKSEAAVAPPVAVKVKAVETNSSSRGVRYSANIEPAKQVDLAFKVSGYLDRILQVRGVDGRMRDVQAGDIVAKGTVLARVRQSEYAVKVSQSQSQVAEAKSSLDSSHAQYAEAKSAVAASQSQQAEAEAAFAKAQLDFERAKNLFASQSMTKADYDAAKLQYESAEAKHAAARSQVAMYEAKANAAKAQIETVRAKVSGSEAAVASAVIPLQDTALRAPMDGIVLQRNVESGALVSPGQAGFVLADVSSVKAVFGVPDLTVGKLKLGGTLTVTTESLPGAEFQGQITRIAPAADAKSRVFTIEVTIANPRRALKAGMIASLEVAAEQAQEPVTVVPVSAIVRAANGAESYAVFVVEETGSRTVARSRPVKLGEAFGNTIAVLEGVHVGERVITTGATLTMDGQTVQVIP